MAAERIPDGFRYRAEDDAAYLVDFLTRGLTGTGEVVEAYEKALAAAYGATHAVTVSSGSAAVMAALGALGLQPGDEVLLAPTCPLCTVYPIQALGLVPVFCDTQPTNFGLDLASLRAAIGPRTRVILDVPMWGYPTPVAQLRALADEHGLSLVLDLAHGHGVQFGGRPLWTYGHIATFSTHEVKFLSTGEGGFILTNDAGLAERVRHFSRYGGLDGVHFGLNLKLGGLQAALGIRRLPLIPEHLRVRHRNARYILDRLTHPRVRELPVVPSGEPSYYYLLLHLQGESEAAAFIGHMDARGVPSDIRKYRCRPLYEFPLLAPYRRPCENARHLLASMTTVPVHPNLGREDLDRIVTAISDFPAA